MGIFLNYEQVLLLWPNHGLSNTVSVFGEMPMFGIGEDEW